MRVLVQLVLWTTAWILVPGLAMAADEVVVATGNTYGYALGAGAAVGFAGLGCGIGQGIAAGGTTSGIARNPGAAGSIQTPMIIGLAFIESLALFAFVIAFLVQGNLG